MFTYTHIYTYIIICIYICTGQPAAPSRSPQPHAPLKNQRVLTDRPSKCTRGFKGSVAAPSITSLVLRCTLFVSLCHPVGMSSSIYKIWYDTLIHIAQCMGGWL